MSEWLPSGLRAPRMIIKRLTDEQSAELREAYDEACAAKNHTAAVNKFYETYSNLYGVSIKAAAPEVNPEVK